MIETWRWFGPDDPVSLADVRQTGATGVVTSLHDIPPGVAWSSGAIAERKAVIERAGLNWAVCESIPVHDAIKRGGKQAKPYIDAWIDTLAQLGRAGVPVVCYNFMPVVDWTRTSLRHPRPDGAESLRFDLVDFVACDLFVLGRRGAMDYPPELVARAEQRFAAMDDATRTQIEQTIVAGLPGGAGHRDRTALLREIATFDGMTQDDARSALLSFLRAVVPVAEEVGVRLAIHPDDPPISLFGLPRVVSRPDDIDSIVTALDTPANGLCFCTGSYGSRGDNDVEAMAERFAARVNFAHLRDVIVDDDGSFEEAPHLEGRTDMLRVLRALLAAERAGETAIPFRADHGHLFTRETATRANPGYSYMGRLRGLAELRGIVTTLEADAAA